VNPRPLGYATLAVLQALADVHQYGFNVIDHTGLPSGTVYPALSTLTRKGPVESHWEEEGVAHLEGRPRRKYYEVTAEGSTALLEAIERFGALGLRPTSVVPESAADER
jgi:DNA-binding PadR family transcriptional regulator